MKSLEIENKQNKLAEERLQSLQGNQKVVKKEQWAFIELPK